MYTRQGRSLEMGNKIATLFLEKNANEWEVGNCNYFEKVSTNKLGVGCTCFAKSLSEGLGPLFIFLKSKSGWECGVSSRKPKKTVIKSCISNIRMCCVHFTSAAHKGRQVGGRMAWPSTRINDVTAHLRIHSLPNQARAYE